MNSLGVAFLLFAFCTNGYAHNIKLLKSQSSDLTTTGLDAAINNESQLKESDTFIEGLLGVSKSTNSFDDSTAENRMLGLQVLTPNFFSIGLISNTYENSNAELKTRTLSLELGKKFFYAQADENGFKPNLGIKGRAEKINLDQSKTFTRRKFEFALEQTSTGISLSVAPLYWLELTGSYYRNSYNEDLDSVKSKLSRFDFISSLFSNIQNTLDSLSDTSKSVSFRFLPYPWIDTTLTRTYSDDLLTDTQFYVDSIDIGIYHFSAVYFFLTAGEQFSSIDTAKHSFTEISVQFNF